MGNCRNCQHWSNEPPSWVPPDHKMCFRITPQEESGLVKLDNPSFAGENAVLWTGPMFGCALWEPRPEPELSKEAEEARRYCG
jgi:hypothetical protein